MVHIREMPVQQFWGLHLQPGRTYTQRAQFDFHVTMAALSLKSKDDKPHSVYCLHNTDRFLLCTLSQGKIWQQQLDLYFTEGEDLGFVVEGGVAEVHLTGHVIHSEEEEAPDLVEMDDSLDYFSGGKRKREANIQNQVMANKAKRLRLEDMEDEDYDSDEDDDFEVDEEEDDSDFDEDDLEAYLGDVAGDFDEDDDEEEEEDDELDDSDDEEEERKMPVTAKGKKNGSAKKGTPGPGSPNKAKPSKATPGKATPGQATPGQATPAQATSGKKKNKKPQTPGAATPGQNKSAGKNTATPGPNTPKNVNTPQNSEGESSKKKKKRNKKKKNKSNANTPTVSDQSSTPVPSTSQQQSPKARQQQTLQGKQQTPKGQATPGRKVLAGGTVVQELKEGQGPAAKPGQKVGVYYRGTLTSGKQFDSKTEGKPLKFRLGAGQVIRGWDEGLQGMKVGGKRKITVPPNMGYGNTRQGPIPPNSSLVFEVELKSVS